MFIITLQQVAILLAFILLGYFFKKINIINEGGKKVLAGLLVNLFAPAYSIVSLSSQVSVEKISEYLVYFLIGTGVSVALVFVAIPFAMAFAKDKFNRNILKYAFAFGNIGYFGYPVVGAVFGAEARALMILFCLPMSITIYTYGYSILTADTEMDANLGKKINWKNALSFLYAPPFLGAVIGIAIGLLGIKLPTFISDFLTIAANCQSAPAMLLTGACLASVPFLKLFTSWKPYAIGLVRMLVIPLIFGGILYIVGVRDIIFMLTVVSVAMPVGMNVVVYPESCGKDGTEGAKTCFISYILALAVLPVVFTLISVITGLGV